MEKLFKHLNAIFIYDLKAQTFTDCGGMFGLEGNGRERLLHTNTYLWTVGFVFFFNIYFIYSEDLGTWIFHLT